MATLVHQIIEDEGNGVRYSNCSNSPKAGPDDILTTSIQHILTVLVYETMSRHLHSTCLCLEHHSQMQSSNISEILIVCLAKK